MATWLNLLGRYLYRFASVPRRGVSRTARSDVAPAEYPCERHILPNVVRGAPRKICQRFAADVPAIFPNTAPDISPVPPG